MRTKLLLLALLAFFAAGLLLSGLGGLRPEPQSAGATFR